MNAKRLNQFRDRRSGEKALNSDPQLKKVGDNKWRHLASGCHRWIDNENWLVIDYGK